MCVFWLARADGATSSRENSVGEHRFGPMSKHMLCPSVQCLYIHARSAADIFYDVNWRLRMDGSLSGLRILDLTRILAGPFCTATLCDLGAEVIKVEHPNGGDLSRGTAPFISDGDSYYYLSVNRGKHSVTLDLTNERGKEIFLDLVKVSDVVIENFRPGTMDRLGLSYNDLRPLNPRIVFASISGFGQTGPYSDRPALDIIVQAMGGLMGITGEPGGAPVRAGTSLSDIVAGLFTTNALLAALYERERSGEGQMVDISMMDCQLSILESAIGRYTLTGQIPQPMGSRHPTFTPFQAFQTQDSWIVIAIVGGLNDMWPRLCAAIERVDLIDDPRFADGNIRTENYEIISPILNEAFLKKTTQEWLEELQGLGIPVGPVNSIEDVVNDPQVQHREMLAEVRSPTGTPAVVVNTPIKMSRSASGPQGPGASLGEHNDWMLREVLGLPADAVEAINASGALGTEH